MTKRKVKEIGINKAYPGKLFIVEGIDGSGKSTQVYLLKRWLEQQGYTVFFTEWNSSDLVKDATRKAKKKNMLTPTTFSLIHAADFADRYERLIWPHLKAGYIVLADRYIYTAYARDIARGVDPAWVRNIYSFAVKPTAAFYFQVPTDIGVSRILRGRAALKYHEAGMDLGLSNNPSESFKLFQGIIKEQYDAMADKEGFHIIDGTLPIEEQQQQMRAITKAMLKRYKPPLVIFDRSSADHEEVDEK